MKKICFTLFCLALCNLAFTQATWKDSIPGYKPDEVAVKDYAVLFKVNQKWGLYDKLERKIFARPEFDYILLKDESYRSSFWVIKNGKIGYFNMLGIEVFPAQYKRIGFVREYDYTEKLLLDDSLYKAERSEDDFYTQLRQAEPFHHARVINSKIAEVIGENIVFHNYSQIQEPTETGETIEYNENKSGVYNLIQQQWIIQPQYWNIYNVNEYFIAMQNFIDKDDPYTIYDTKGNLIKKHESLDSWQRDVLLQKKILHATEIHHFSQNFPDECSYVTNNKMGIFSLARFKSIVPPVHDFIHYASGGNIIFYKKDNKFGAMLSIRDSTFGFPSQYDSISIYDDPEPYGYSKFLQLNDKWAVISDNTFQYLTERPYVRTENARYAIQSSGDNIVIHDYISKSEEGPLLVIKDGMPVDSIDENGNLVYVPLYHEFFGSGIFNTTTKKWMVPARYKKIYVFPDRFIGVKQSIEITNKDSVFLQSLYKANGELVYKYQTPSTILGNPSYLAATTGQSGITVTDTSNFSGKGILPFSYIVGLSQNNKKGMYDVINNKWIVPLQFDDVFKMKYASYILTFKNNKAGMYNLEGQEVIPAIHKSLSTYQYNEIIADEKWSYTINDNPPAIIKAKLAQLKLVDGPEFYFYNSKFSVLKRNNEWIVAETEVPILESYEEIAQKAGIVTLLEPGKKYRQLQNITNLTPLPQGYIITMNDTVYYTDDQFNPIEKIHGHGSYQSKNGFTYFYQTDQYGINFNRDITEWPGSIEDGASPLYYFKLYNNFRRVAIPEQYKLLKYFSTGKALVYEIRKEENILSLHFHLIEHPSGKILKDNIQFKNLPEIYDSKDGCFISDFSIYSETGDLYLLNENADTLKKWKDTKIRSTYFNTGEDNLTNKYVITYREENQLVPTSLLIDGTGKTIAREMEENLIRYISRNSRLLHDLDKGEYITNAKGDILAGPFKTIDTLNYRGYNSNDSKLMPYVFKTETESGTQLLHLDGNLIQSWPETNLAISFTTLDSSKNIFAITTLGNHYIAKIAEDTAFLFSKNKYAHVESFDPAHAKNNTLFLALEEKGYALINPDGKYEYTFKAGEVPKMYFPGTGVVVVRNEKKGKYYFLDLKNKKMLKPAFTMLEEKYQENNHGDTLHFSAADGKKDLLLELWRNNKGEIEWIIKQRIL